MHKMKKIALFIGISVLILSIGLYAFIRAVLVDMELESLGDANGDDKIKVETLPNGTETKTNSFTQKDFDEYKKICNDISNIEKKYTDDNEYVEKSSLPPLLNEVGEYAEQQKKLGIVSYYNVNEGSVYIKLINGMGIIFQPRIFGQLSGGTDLKITTFEPDTSWREALGTWITSRIDIWYNDLEYTGSYSLETNAKFIVDNIASSGNGYHYEKSLSNESVSFKELKNLKNNSVIIWNGHGGYDKDLHSYLFLNHKFQNFTDLNDDDISADINEDCIILSANGNDAVITSKFIEKYFKGCTKNTLVYLGACYSGKDTVLADSFLSNGASAVYAYSDSTSLFYELVMRTYTFLNLTSFDNDNNYFTVKEALLNAQSRLGSNDKEAPYAELLLSENSNENFRLIDNLAKSKTGVVSGIVKENATPEKRLQDVSLNVYNANSRDTRKISFTKTNDRGEFELFLAEGNYRLEFTIDNYASKNIDVSIKSGEKQSLGLIALDSRNPSDIQSIHEKLLAVKSWFATESKEVAANYYMDVEMELQFIDRTRVKYSNSLYDAGFGYQLLYSEYTYEINGNQITFNLGNGMGNVTYQIKVDTPTSSQKNYTLHLTSNVKEGENFFAGVYSGEKALPTGRKDTSWKQLYIDYINKNPGYQSDSSRVSALPPEYTLIRINNDDIPELAIHYTSSADGGVICTVSDNTLEVLTVSNHGISYILEGNLFAANGGNMDVYYDEIYKIQNGKFVRIHRGDYGAEDNSNVQIDSNGNPIYQYHWNNQKVTKTKYEQSLASAFDKQKSTSSTYLSCSADEIIAMIKKW